MAQLERLINLSIEIWISISGIFQKKVSILLTLNTYIIQVFSWGKGQTRPFSIISHEPGVYSYQFNAGKSIYESS